MKQALMFVGGFFFAAGLVALAGWIVIRQVEETFIKGTGR